MASGRRMRLLALAVLLACLFFAVAAQDGGFNDLDIVGVDNDAEKDLITTTTGDEPYPTAPHHGGASAEKTDTSFFHGFIASLSVIIVSELGDKTFFIAAIMAMQHSRTIVLAGALGALAIMTALSAGMGWLITVVPRVYTFYASTILFAAMGIKLLREGLRMSPDEESEELEEVAQELKKKEEELEMSRRGSVPDVEAGESPLAANETTSKWMEDIRSGILLQAFTMTFLAEWGDRSQITTVVLAARENVYGVTIGGTLGHAICTSIAVIGGRLLAQRISVRTVTISGGVVFLFFAAMSIIQGPEA